MIGLIGGMLGGLFGGGAKSNSTTDPLERQQKFAEQMANKQADAAILKMKLDTDSAISAGKTGSWTQANNALSTAAKDIRY